MARLLNVSPGLVSQWSKGRRPVAAHHVLVIEQASGISRHRLSANVFGTSPADNAPAPHAFVARPADSRMSKRALRSRLGLTSDAHLAKILQLPVEQVAAWPEEQGVPALPQVLHLLGVQEQPAADASPNDPDAERVIQVQVA